MIVDSKYYTDQFKGSVLPADQIDRFLDFATYDIHVLTRNRTVDHAELTPFQLDLVQRAICHQAEHLFTRNDVSGLNIRQLSSDKTSVTYAEGESVRFSRIARDLIKNSGLAYAGFF